MLMAGLIVFGTISFRRMGVSQLPDVDFPVVSVNLTWEGAAPEVMETDVVDIAETLELWALDFAFKRRPPIRESEKIVLVDIDDDRLSASCITVDGTVADRFELRARAGR
jgi:hypothetical protein